MEIILNSEVVLRGDDCKSVPELKNKIRVSLTLNDENYYLLHNGKVVTDILPRGKIHIILRTVGGKGGFGSMLRAIGAQIEKTTNREACRDLSGRRLRDINEEQRLKNWIAQQADREKETLERRQKKLERLCEQPKHEFKDEVYDKERSALPEKVEDAVLQGLQASCSSKRSGSQIKAVKKKKPKLWVDDELDEDISSSDGDDDSGKSDSANEKETAKGSEVENSCSGVSRKGESKDDKSESENNVVLSTPESSSGIMDKDDKLESESNEGKLEIKNSDGNREGINPVK